MEKTKMNDEQMEQVAGGSIITYSVQPGDTLNGLAQRFHVTVDQLQKWNNIQNPNIIAVGQQIRVKF